MASSIVQCPSCGKRSTTYVEFVTCWSCGYEFSAIKPKPPQAPHVEPVAPAATARPSRKGQQGGLTAILMGVGALAIPVFLLVQCTSIGQSSEERLLGAKRVELKRLADGQSSNENACFQREVELNQARGQQALADWDNGAAANLENVSEEQEWEIRKSLGREMGLAPSEVNGWKDIYRSRAEGAARNNSSVQNDITEAQAMAKQVCDWRDQSRRDLDNLKAEVNRLEAIVRKQNES